MHCLDGTSGYLLVVHLFMFEPVGLSNNHLILYNSNTLCSASLLSILYRCVHVQVCACACTGVCMYMYRCVHTASHGFHGLTLLVYYMGCVFLETFQAFFLCKKSKWFEVNLYFNIVPYLTTTINSTYGAVLVQMSTESAQTTCMHCYNPKHLQSPCTCK